jgi:hypothetical protein
MPLYTFLHKLLNVLVQIASKMGYKKNPQEDWRQGDVAGCKPTVVK